MEKDRITVEEALKCFCEDADPEAEKRLSGCDLFQEAIRITMEMNTRYHTPEYLRELFKILEASGKTVREGYPGIYYISGRLPFEMQVVVTSQLSARGHSALRILSNHARMEDVRRFIEEVNQYTDPGDRSNADAVLQVSISANRALYDEIRRDHRMCEALENLMKDVIEEREEQATRQNTLNNLRSMMSTLKLTAEQAMSALQIPPSEQATYLREIQ